MEILGNLKTFNTKIHTITRVSDTIQKYTIIAALLVVITALSPRLVNFLYRVVHRQTIPKHTLPSAKTIQQLANQAGPEVSTGVHAALKYGGVAIAVSVLSGIIYSLWPKSAAYKQAFKCVQPKENPLGAQNWFVTSKRAIQLIIKAETINLTLKPSDTLVTLTWGKFKHDYKARDMQSVPAILDNMCKFITDTRKNRSIFPPMNYKISGDS